MMQFFALLQQNQSNTVSEKIKLRNLESLASIAYLFIRKQISCELRKLLGRFLQTTSCDGTQKDTQKTSIFKTLNETSF